MTGIWALFEAKEAADLQREVDAPLSTRPDPIRRAWAAVEAGIHSNTRKHQEK